MIKDCQVAVLQMNTQEDKEANLSTALQLIDEAASAGADLVALPEYFNFLGRAELKKQAAEEIPGPTTKALADRAVKHNIWIHGGSILEVGPEDRCYNTSFVINPQGEIVAKYHKIHLFDVVIPGRVDARESASIEAGKEPVVAETALGKIGLSICYDLRFPELYRSLMFKGADIIAIPAAFTLYTGKDHWEVLLRARAIENQAYVLAPGQFGKHPEEQSCFGNSMIIDPWGTVIARAGEGVGWAMARIRAAELERVRTNVPALTHIRRELYADFK